MGIGTEIIYESSYAARPIKDIWGIYPRGTVIENETGELVMVAEDDYTLMIISGPDSGHIIDKSSSMRVRRVMQRIVITAEDV